MNSKHLQTLKAIFATPTSKGLQWDDVLSLFIALGASVHNGDGSRVKFEFKGATIALHRPHKPKTARAYQVELIRRFLSLQGVSPDE